MSSQFSRKITMLTASGCLTGEGTPLNQRTGRKQTYRSSIWRSATFSDRMPPPTGVVNGPLIATRYLRHASSVSSGNQEPARLFAFSPASTSIQLILRLPPYALATAASITRWLARQTSGPIPSPSMNGIIGLSGTCSWPFEIEILLPSDGTEICVANELPPAIVKAA